jgi:hypothetical protein
MTGRAFAAAIVIGAPLVLAIGLGGAALIRWLV